jgi:uncharacterized protein
MENDEKQLSEEAKDTIDRKLGDEWSDWVGDLSKYEKEIVEGKRTFLLFYFSALFIITLLSMGAYYMVSPRLLEINPFVDAAVLWSVIIVFGILFIYSLLLLLTLTTGINFVLASKKSGLHMEWIYPAIYKIGGFFGVSKDKIGHSLVKVNNALIYTTKKKFKANNLLVLLPRCLDREMRTKATEITAKYGCHVFTATGGTSARQMLKKIRPDAIIGVACERDLVAGMTDSPHYIPIIAITNKRPQGPCKDTEIDIDEFEKAIRFLSKK